MNRFLPKPCSLSFNVGTFGSLACACDIFIVCYIVYVVVLTFALACPKPMSHCQVKLSSFFRYFRYLLYHNQTSLYGNKGTTISKLLPATAKPTGCLDHVFRRTSTWLCHPWDASSPHRQRRWRGNSPQK